MTDKQIIEREILYQGLNWFIGVDGCYINNTEKEPILNHLYEVALACRDKSEQLKRKEQECENWQKELDKTHLLMLEKQDALIKSMQECERLKQGYAELTEIVSPYMDDFTGYNEELGGSILYFVLSNFLNNSTNSKLNYKLKKFGTK